MTKKVKKINQMRLADIQKKLDKLLGQESSQYFKHLTVRKNELKKEM